MTKFASILTNLVLVLEGQVLVDMWQVLYFYYLVCLTIECSAQSCPENCGKINVEIGNIAVKSFY